MKKHLTCIIVDDEPPAIRLLEKYVEKIADLRLLKTFTKPLEVLAFLENNNVDIIFLDIQMPDITGIQLSKIIHQNTHVIFTTAYPEFALESYTVDAMDYLLKPIEFERFYKAVKKVPSQNSNTTSNRTSEIPYIFFKTDGKNKFKKVFLTDVLYFQGLKNYVSVQLPDEQIITYSTLKHIMEMLPEGDFIQVHRSYIVSIEQIDQIENDAIWIKNRQVPIGNTFRKSFFDRINNNEV